MGSTGGGLRRLSRLPELRRIVLPVLSRLNPGDITVHHPWTGDRIMVHSFRHRGYWFYGRDRERRVVTDFIRLVGRREVVFDVGGHIGFTALLFASLAPEGVVHVFEPGPDNLRYLRRNVEHADNVTVVAAAVGAQRGRAPMQVENLSGQNNSLVPDEAALGRTARSTHVAPKTDIVDVEVITLDAYMDACGTPPAFVKVDVEGFEWEVLQGAAHLTEAHHPAWMIELTRRRDEIVDWLASQGYEALDDDLRRLERAPWAGQNVLFLHRHDHRWALDRFAR